MTTPPPNLFGSFVTTIANPCLAPVYVYPACMYTGSIQRYIKGCYSCSLINVALIRIVLSFTYNSQCMRECKFNISEHSWVRQRNLLARSMRFHRKQFLKRFLFPITELPSSPSAENGANTCEAVQAPKVRNRMQWDETCEKGYQYSFVQAISNTYSY